MTSQKNIPKTSLIDDGIAIVGTSVRLPGGCNGVSDFWQVLIDGKDLITEVSSERWNPDAYYYPEKDIPGKAYTKSAGQMDNIWDFDADFFNISPREASQMDPQQRLLLELSWEAFDEAGIKPSSIRGSNTSVCVGISSNDFANTQFGDTASANSFFMLGTTMSIASNRLSYFYDIHGSSFSVDTACSSSLYALEHACQKISSGQSDMAICGGVSVLLTPFPFVGFSQASMLSPDGRCKAFDSSGNGYVRSEGGGILLLKKLSHAIRDGDPIVATIAGVGTNSDGRTNGISLPSSDYQEALLRSVYASANINPQSVDYIEAHGTGTIVGDAAEVGAIGRFFGPERQDENPLLIGSAKTNAGHLEAGSGMIGLIKAALVVKNSVVPPSLHVKELRKDIPFKDYKISVATRVHELPAKKEPITVGINSFGFGGANGHAILQSYNAVDAAAPIQIEGNATLLPLWLSARSEYSLKAIALEYADILAKAGFSKADYHALAASTVHHRETFEYRFAANGQNLLEIQRALIDFAKDDVLGDGCYQSHSHTADKDIAFIFSGNGSQFVGMAQELLETTPEFRGKITELDKLISSKAGWSILDVLRNTTDENIADTTIAQPLIMSIQIALIDVLKNNGITPKASIGHSVGEVAAAYSAGILTIEQAVDVILTRSNAQGKTRGTGGMAAIELAPDALQALLAETSVSAEIAGYNGPTSLTLSGLDEELLKLKPHCKKNKILFKKLGLEYPFHSSLMDPVETEIRTNLKHLAPQSEHGTFISTVTGTVLSGDHLNAAYWWDNIRKPVQFHAAIEQAWEEGCRAFVEIGPKAILGGYLKNTLKGKAETASIVPCLNNQSDEIRLKNIASAVFAEGGKIDLDRLFNRGPKSEHLPGYVWDKQRHFLEDTSETRFSLLADWGGPLLGERKGANSPEWMVTLGALSPVFLKDHQVGDTTIFPAAGFLEIALAAGRALYDDACLTVENMEIHAPLALEDKSLRHLTITLDPTDGKLEIRSRPYLSDSAGITNATATVQITPSKMAPSKTWASMPQPANSNAFDKPAFYETTKELGLTYGPFFQTVDDLSIEGACVHATLNLSDALMAEENIFNLHPCLADGCLQSLFALLIAQSESKDIPTYLPSVFGKVTLYKPFAAQITCSARITRVSARSVIADFRLFDENGDIVADLEACRFRRFENAQRSKGAATYVQVLVPATSFENESPALTSIAEDAAAFTHTATPIIAAPYAEEVTPLIDALIASFIVEALSDLSADIHAGFRSLDLIANDQMDPAQSRYFNALLNILSEDGILDQDGEIWKLSDGVDLYRSADIWHLLIADHPELLPELTIIGRNGLQLPRILRGEIDPDRLALHSDTALTKQLIEGSAFAAPSDDLLNKTVIDYLNTCPSDRQVRVLEFDGQNVLGTHAILDAAPADRFEYVFTSTDSNVVHRANSLLAPINGVSCELLDSLEPDNVSKFIANQQPYDLIIVRGTPWQPPRYEIVAPLTRALLGVGGELFIAQNSSGRIPDFIAGGQPAWWDRSPSTDQLSPLTLSEKAWAHNLKSNCDITVQTLLSADNSSFHNAVVLRGQKSTATANDFEAEDSAKAPATPELLFIVTSASEEEQQLAARIAGLRPQNPTVLLTPGGAVEKSDAGHICYGTGSADDFKKVATVMASDNLKPHAILYLAGLSLTDEAQATPAQEIRCGSLINLLQGFTDLLEDAALTLITQSSQYVDADDHVIPLQAPLWGLGRVIANEYSDLTCKLVDIAGHKADIFGAATAKAILAEINHQDRDGEVILRGSRRLASRLRAVTPPASAKEAPQKLRLDFAQPGALENLRWFEMTDTALAPDQIEIQMQATGLNFRDVMWALGILKDEAVENGYAGPTLGMEGAGIISAVGAEISDLAIGDRVMCFAPSCFADYVVTKTTAVAKIPDSMTFEEAATIPSVFFTIYYALNYLARLEPGEKVLIHGAAGGVGLAAIQYCHHIGAEIYVTAGSDEKRDFLKLLGCEHVLDSRSLEFADQIMELTDGEGIDVVLNSLSGAAIAKNLSILKPFGRFLELGKRDFYADSKIGLRPFRNNITYYGIDADQLLAEKPALSSRLFKEMMSLFETEAFKPLVHLTFAPTQIEEAFRTLQQSRHIGKIIVSMADKSARKLGMKNTHAAIPAATSAGCCVITGGQGGFGLATARKLSEHKFKHFVLLGRSGVKSEEDQQQIDHLRESGVTVETVNVDVTDKDQLSAALAAIRSSGTAITGIVHCAMVLDDGLIANIEPESLNRVLAPKIKGAWNLHELTQKDPLDLFLMYSSATTYIGNPGQGSYVAGNSYLEALTSLRRQMGLTSTTVAWGAIDDVGVLSGNNSVKEILTKRTGLKAMSSSSALAGLETLLDQDAANVALLQLDWGNVTRNFSAGATSRYDDIRHLATDGPNIEDSDDFMASLQGKSHDEVVDLVTKLVIGQISAITGSSVEKISPEKSLFDLGIDSLMTLELTMELERKMGIEMSSMSVLGGGNISDLSEKVAGLLTGTEAPSDTENSELETLMSQHGLTAEDTDDTSEVAKQSSL